MRFSVPYLYLPVAYHLHAWTAMAFFPVVAVPCTTCSIILLKHHPPSYVAFQAAAGQQQRGL